jgi:hypothetical protein
MFDNFNPLFIALWALAIILGITIHILNLHERLIKWYRKRTKKIKISEFSSSSIKILNFSHPITDVQRIKIEELIGKSIAEIMELQTQLDEDISFQSQLCDIMSKAKISSEGLQKGEYIINLPGFASAAAVLLAELHGRMGHFPTVIRLKRVKGSLPPVFDVEEVVNLQAIRDDSRKCR